MIDRYHIHQILADSRFTHTAEKRFPAAVSSKIQDIFIKPLHLAYRLHVGQDLTKGTLWQYKSKVGFLHGKKDQDKQLLKI